MKQSTWQSIKTGIYPAIIKSYASKSSRQKRKPEMVSIWKNRDEFSAATEAELANGTYHVGPYKHFRLQDRKKMREISVLSVKDRVVLNDQKDAIQPIIMKLMTDDMMGGLPGRGILAGGTRKIKKANLRYCVVRRMRIAMNNPSWKYYLQGDISKFYDNIDNVIAMRILERKITHRRTLALIRQHLFNQKQLAIGDPMSHLIANMVMSQIIRKAKAKYGSRVLIINFADDFIAFAKDKETLNDLRRDLKRWAKEFRLHYKSMQVHPIDAAPGKPTRKITFCGYVYIRGAVFITKRMKRNIVSRRHKKRSMGSYQGMLDIADTKHLKNLIIHKNNTHMNEEKKIHRPFAGQPVKIDVLMGRNHTIVDFQKRQSKTKGSSGAYYYHIQAVSKTLKLFVYSTGSEKIVDYLNTKSAADLPLKDMVIQKDWSGYFYEGTVYTDEEEEAFLREKYGLKDDE